MTIGPSIAVVTRRSLWHSFVRGRGCPFVGNPNPLAHRAVSTTTTSENIPGGSSSVDDRKTIGADGFFSLPIVAAGRSRKRPRPWRQQHRKDALSVDTKAKTTTAATIETNPTLSSRESPVHNSAFEPSGLVLGENEKDEEPLPYPKGKPWRVLFPYPHGEPTGEPPLSLWDYRKKIPTPRQLKDAWVLYKQTWEDGLQGASEEPNSKALATTSSSTTTATTLSAQEQLQEVGDNASKNLQIVREDAQNLLEHAKETTGIRTQDDAKALASEALKIATECIREFMAGYRKGRDSEIDKVLHEYFQDEDDETKETKTGGTNGESNDGKTAVATPPNPRRKKRKPKRGIPRD